MKRFWLIMMTAALLLTTACGKENAVPEAKFFGIITEVSKTHAVVEVAEGEEERASADLISFGTADLEKIGAEIGDTVEVTYTGVIMETYPAQVIATAWELTEKASKAIGEEEKAADTSVSEEMLQGGEEETADVENAALDGQPPVLHVISGEAEIDANSGNYQWVSDVLPDGTQQSVIACGPHPLQMELPEEVLSVAEGGSMELRFDVQPEQISCRCWEEQYWGDEASLEANYEVVEVDNFHITPPSLLRYVYEVNADWGNGCEATYVFWALTDAVPSAE